MNGWLALLALTLAGLSGWVFAALLAGAVHVWRRRR